MYTLSDFIDQLILVAGEIDHSKVELRFEDFSPEKPKIILTSTYDDTGKVTVKLTVVPKKIKPWFDDYYGR